MNYISGIDVGESRHTRGCRVVTRLPINNTIPGVAAAPKPAPAPEPEQPGAGHTGRHWTFLSTHAQVAVCIARDPGIRLRDVAAYCGITERAVQKIVSDLEAEGFIERIREGRRNRYILHRDRPLRHPLGQHRTLGALLSLITGPEPKA